MDQRFDHVGDHELDAATKRELRAVTDGFFARPLEKAEQFDWEEFKRNEAFKAIMMPSPLFWVLANFERSFTQKLGQQMYEAFGQAVAETSDSIGPAATQHACTDLHLSHAAENRIETIIAELADGDREPDWQQEQAEITEVATTTPTANRSGRSRGICGLRTSKTGDRLPRRSRRRSQTAIRRWSRNARC